MTFCLLSLILGAHQNGLRNNPRTLKKSLYPPQHFASVVKRGGTLRY